MSRTLAKVESILIRITFVQFIFLVLAQILLQKKAIAPFLSHTIFSEGVYFEYVRKTMVILDCLL